MNYQKQLPENEMETTAVPPPNHSQTSFTKVITAVTTRLINLDPHDIDNGINHVLALLGEFTQAERSIVVLIQDRKFHNTHEWCAPDTPSGQEQLQDIPLEALPWLHDQLVQANLIHISQLSQLPPEAQKEKTFLTDWGAQSFTAVPLTTAHKRLGFLGLQTLTRPHTWDHEEISLLQIVGEIFTNAFQKKEIEQREKSAYQIGARLASLLDTNDLLRLVSDQLRESFGYYHTQIFLVNNLLTADPHTTPEHLVVQASAGIIGERLKERRHTILLNAPRSIVARAARTRQPIAVNDVRQISFHLPNPVLPNTRSEVAIPLLDEEKLIGVLDVQHTDRNHFNEDEIRTLQIIANQLSTALSKSALFTHNRRLVEELSVLQAVTKVAADVRDQDTLFARVTDIIAETFQTDLCGFALVNPQTGNRTDHPSYHYPHNRPTLTIAGPGEGICGQVIQSGKPRRVADVRQEPAFIGDPEMRSELCVPIHIDQQIVGLINVESRHLNAFSLADEQLLITIADQMATTITRLNLFNSANRQAAQTAALLATSKAISSLKLDHVLNTIATEAKKLFTADTCRIHLVEPDGKTLNCVVAISEHTEQAILNFALTIGIGITGSIAQSGVPELINNTLYDRRGIQIPGTPEENEAMALAPLIIRGEVIGVMTMTRRDVRHPFTSGNLQLLTAFADQAAVAIDNARLFAAEQRRLEELTLLNEVTSASAQATTEDELLERATPLIRRALQVEQITVFLLDEWGHTLYAHPSYQGPELRIPLGQGVVGKIAVTGEALVVADITTIDEAPDLFPGLSSLLAVPIKIGDRIIGVLLAASRQQDVFDHSDEQLLHTFSRQLSTGLEKTRLIATEKRRAWQQSRLAETAGQLMRTHTLQELGPIVTAVAQQILAADRLAIYIYNTQTKTVLPLFTHNLSDEYTAGVIQQYTQMPATQLINQNQPIVITDALADPRTAVAQDLIRREGFRAYIAYSLSLTDHPLGALIIYRDQATHFNADTLATGQTLAYILSIAYQNILLLDEIRQALSREQRLNEMTRTLNTTPDLPTILADIVRTATDLLNADAGLVGLVIDRQIMTFYPHNIPGSVNLRPTTKGSDIAWEIVATGEPISQANYADHPKALEKLVRVGARAFIGVPITAGEERLGVLQLFSFTPGHQFSQRDVALAESIGRQAGVALQNGRLINDLSERATALSLALARQEELDEAKNQFIQNVSHELRTPLGLIFGYAELLDSGGLGELPATQQQAVTIIIKRTRMLINLLEDMSVLLAAETQEFRREEINPAELLISIHEEFQIQAESTGVELALQLTEPLPVIIGDPFHLRRAFDNLLANAFKFTPAGGAIYLYAWTEGRELIIEVSDTGVGIDPEEMQRIFERFYRANAQSAQHHKGKGTGLGLALVKEIVEAHRGKITVRSQLGAGVTFQIRLPGAG